MPWQKNHPPTHDLPRRGDFSQPGVAALRLPWVRDIPARPEPWRGSPPAWLRETGSACGLLMAKMPVEFGSLSIRLPRRKPAPTGLRRSGCPVTQGSRKAANPGLSKNVPSGHGLAHRPLPDVQPFSCTPYRLSLPTAPLGSFSDVASSPRRWGVVIDLGTRFDLHEQIFKFVLRSWDRLPASRVKTHSFAQNPLLSPRGCRLSGYPG